MTPEEAAEIVLAGNAWQPCPSCQGKGEIESRDQDFGEVTYYECTHCGGEGYWRVDAFVEACKVLGREYPKKKMSSKEMKAWFEKSLGKMSTQGILDALNGPSVTRRIFPSYPIKKSDEEP